MDGNENIKENNWFNKQNNNFTHVHASRFFIHFFPINVLNNCDVKMPTLAFYGGRNKQRRNFVYLSELGYGLLKLSFRRVHLHLAK